MKCSNCGGDIQFSPNDNLLKCNTCDYTADISTEEQKTKQSLYSKKEHLTVNSYVEHCSSCGAESILNEQESSKNCPYCSSPVVKKNLTGLELPDNIIEFSITKEQSRDFVRQWMKSRWFTPNLFKKFGQENSLYDVEGCYLPFWSFDADTFTTYQGQKGTRKTRKVGDKTETYMSWEDVSGSFFLDFRNELQIAQSSIKETLVDDLNKWNFGKSKKFTVDFLRGFKSLIANIHVDKAWPIVKNNILSRITYKIKEYIGGDDQRIDSKKTIFSNEKYLQICLPVWMFTYKFNNKIYQVSVNGQTGEIDGERPYSWIKITLFSLLVTAAIAILFYIQNNK